jgi:hypothetical protein
MATTFSTLGDLLLKQYMTDFVKIARFEITPGQVICYKCLGDVLFDCKHCQNTRRTAIPFSDLLHDEEYARNE